jgi:hypothetical protein
MKGIYRRTASIPVLLLVMLGGVPMPRMAAEGRVSGSATALFCAFGSVGLIPVPRPAGFESEFAVTVVEIRSAAAMANVPVSDFVLLDRHGRTTAMKRVVQVDVFEPEPFTQARAGQPGMFAYYLNPGLGNGAHSWDRTLPAGTIRLRIRVALTSAPLEPPERFQLRLGPYVIEGPVDGSWPT